MLRIRDVYLNFLLSCFSFFNQPRINDINGLESKQVVLSFYRSYLNTKCILPANFATKVKFTYHCLFNRLFVN